MIPKAAPQAQNQASGRMRDVYESVPKGLSHTLTRTTDVSTMATKMKAVRQLGDGSDGR